MSGTGQVPGQWGWHHWHGVVAVPAAACVHTCQAERRLQVLDRKESQAQRRLRELAQRIATLQERGRDAHHTAQRAKDTAQRATTTSGTLNQVSSTPAGYAWHQAGTACCGCSASPCPSAARTWYR